jgi:hypothetical protein
MLSLEAGYVNAYPFRRFEHKNAIDERWHFDHSHCIFQSRELLEASTTKNTRNAVNDRIAMLHCPFIAFECTSHAARSESDSLEYAIGEPFPYAAYLPSRSTDLECVMTSAPSCSCPSPQLPPRRRDSRVE